MNTDNDIRGPPQAIHGFSTGAVILFNGPKIVTDFSRVPLYPVRRHTKGPAMREDNPSATDLGLGFRSIQLHEF